MEGWLLVSCSCSSSSMQEELKEASARGAVELQEEGRVSRRGGGASGAPGATPT